METEVQLSHQVPDFKVKHEVIALHKNLNVHEFDM